METCEWLLKKGRRYHCVPKTVKVTTALDPRDFDELNIATIGEIEMKHDGNNLGIPQRSATKEGRRPPEQFLDKFHVDRYSNSTYDAYSNQFNSP